MKTKNVYLKPNVIVEPLFNQWYAWSYLISPATAAMYIANSHLAIMESFIDAPQVHMSALKNPAMIGGPFINYDASRVDEIKALLETTKEEQAHMLELAQAIKDLEKMLAEANGYSLEPLYQKVPEILKGYVELVYDSNNHPSIRFIEGLLYTSHYYNTLSQSVALYLANEDERSFVLSTPRLKDEHCLHLNLPFNDQRLAQLFKMKDFSQSYTQIKDTLGIKDEDEPLFSSFFTEQPPQREPKYSGDGVRIRYFGHACILIETKEISILCDPLISYQHQNGIPRYTYTDLPEIIDYALITHNHQDHCLFETLLQLRHKIKNLIVPKNNKGVLIDPSLKFILQKIGFSSITEIDEVETLEIANGQIISLPVLGEHGDLNISTKTAYLINLKERKILCAADSNNIEPKLYKHLHNLIGNLDVMFIGMECDGAPFTWAYGSLLTKQIPRKMAQTRRLDGSNAEKAMKLVSQFNPQQVYVYAMGQEPWLTYITSIQYTDDSRPIIESNKLIEACKNRNIMSERLFGRKELFLEENSVIASSNGGRPREDNVTKTLEEFLSDLCYLDVKLWADGERLRCNAPKGTLTPTLKAQLSERKREILKFLDKANSTGDVAALNAEAVLDPTVRPETVPAQPTTEPACIFFTGATGFLGTFLLYELLEKTQADIYCLVRCENTESGKQKIQSRLKSYLLWNESFSTRIIPVVGDLAQPLLGLSEEQFRGMADKIDVIYHNGAWVHHTSPYSLLKATNVLGTQEVLRLASQIKVKPVHYISTISVFPAGNHSGIKVIREDSLDDGQIPMGGYTQSKWVAEKLVAIAGERGLPVCIYRLGPISGHSQTGVFNVNDFLYRLMLGYIQLGSAPEGELLLDITPVDYASKAIVHLSKQKESWGKPFHLVHPHPVSSNILFNQLLSMGYTIQRVSYDQWHDKLLDIAKNFPKHALYPLVSLFSREQNSNPASLEINCQNTLDGLAGSSIVCPPIDDELLSTYLSHLIHSGFVDAPQQRSELEKAR